MKLKRLSLFLALVMIISAFAGTFTFASAATAGGTFEIWRDGAKVEDYTGTIATAVEAEKIKDGDTIKLTSDYISMAVDQSITMNLTIDGQGYTLTNNVSGSSGRLFNIGGPGTNDTGVITVTFKNMTMYSKTSLVQVNSVGGTVIFDNVDMTATGNTNILVMTKASSTITMQNGSTLLTTGHNWIKDTDTATDGNQYSDTYSVFYMGADKDTVNIVDSTVTAGAVYAVVNPRSTNQTVNFDGATMISKGFKGRDTWVHGFVNQETAATNLVVNVTDGSSFDGRQNEYFRLMYLRAGSTLNLDDCVFYGSDNSHDIMQVNAGTTVNLGKNIVFVGGGTNSPGKVIIRNGPASVGYYDSNDSFNKIKIVNRDTEKYASDAALLQGMFGVPAVNGTNYDEVAAAMGYVVRVGTAEEAYAGGKFTGYYPAWHDAASGNGANATTITLINDAFWRARVDISKDWTIDLNGYTLTNMNAYVRLTNLTANLTIKNGTIKGFAGNGNMVQMQNTAKGIALNIENVKFDLQGSGTTGLFYCLGQNQSVNFKGNVTVVANHAVHTLVDMYASNVTVSFTDGEFTVVQFSRVAYTETTNHDGTGAVTGAKFTVTNAVLRTDAWGGVFQNQAGVGVVTLKNADIMMPTSIMANGQLEQQFLRLREGTSVTVNGGTIAAPANNGDDVANDYYFMPASKMLTGASVRIARGDKLAESGIRFESQLSVELIESVSALLEADAIKNCKIGTVVFKVEDLGNKSVAQLVKDANADKNDDLIVADIEAVDGIVMNEDGSATIRAAIINIKEKNYGVKFGAVAYLEYETANGETVRIYGNYNATNNSRSIKQVAEAALADYKLEAGVVDGCNYYNEITVEIEGVETTVYSCYSDEQIAILNTYAGK